MDIKFGCIYLVNFDPSMGKEYQKVRPAIVIQSDIVMKYSSLVTIMPISSQINKRETKDILIVKDNKNRHYRDSINKVTQISSFDKKRFSHSIGQANNHIISEIKKYLTFHFNL